jgi:hypothetical protein
VINMRRSKCKVRVNSSKGQGYTSKRGARRMIDRGLAERRPDGELRMIESDHRFNCETPSSRGPRFEVVAWGYVGPRPTHGFAHFPLPIQTSSGELRRCA